MLGRYQKIESIGAGGTGTVFAVRDMLQGGRALAMKVANAEEQNDRIVEEFDSLRRLGHPALPAVFDCGLEPTSGKMFFTMEWCRGATLDSWLATQPSEEERLRVLGSLFRCISHLHERDVIHGDLSPLNVLVRQVSGNHEVKVLDLAFSGHDSAGGVSGALEYLAPETLERGLKEKASDVFSLGLLAFQTLFGHHPFPEYPRTKGEHILFPSGLGGLTFDPA